MNRKRRPPDDDEMEDVVTTQAKPNVFHIKRPALDAFADKETDEKRKYIPWIKARLYEVGILGMENEPVRPPGFYVNWTTVTGIILVVSSIVGLWFFTWQAASDAGFQRGVNETERRMLNERLQKAEQDAAEAKKFSVYAAAGSDAETGHKPKPKEKK